jgi:hypothetical protein
MSATVAGNLDVVEGSIRHKAYATRWRATAMSIGLIVFAAAGSHVASTDPIYLEAWFAVGVGTALSATFGEPFWTAPQDALVNSAVGLFAVAATHPDDLRVVWILLLIVYVAVFTASIYATLASDTPAALKEIALRLSRQLGRAVVVGASALLLQVMALADARTPSWPYLAFGSIFLLLMIAVDWPAMARAARSARDGGLATATAALGPRLLLVSAPGIDLAVGCAVKVSRRDTECIGTVIARLPHAPGLRLEVALQSDVATLCGHFPVDVLLESIAEEHVVGAVGPGTTDRAIDFLPSVRMYTGDPLRVGGAEQQQDLLYQITGLELVRTEWSGSAAVVPRAHASLVGSPREGFIRLASGLPDPHSPIKRWQDLAADLPAAFERIGRVKGTEFPIGINVDDPSTGHVAIMGMSGMGKTSMARRVSEAFGARCLAVVLDTTGEYRQKLGFQTWNRSFAATGHFVHEPAGVPPQQAAAVIKDFMDQGATEYAAGTTTHRVVVLEEAHTFLSEFGFRERDHEVHVSQSGRYIMQSRKFGLRFIIVSQRSAVVTKSALSQCENYIAFKTIDDTSLNYLESVVGSEIRRIITGLARYEAVCVGPAFNSEAPVIITVDPPPASASVREPEDDIPF